MWLVFNSDGVGVGVVSGVTSATEAASQESERFHFLPTPLTTPSLTFRLWSSENRIVVVGSRSWRTNQSQCTFPRFVIGLVLLLLLPTSTIWFSLYHKRNVSDGVVSGIGTLLSLDHKLDASDYDFDSDSVASENQPLRGNCVTKPFVSLIEEKAMTLLVIYHNVAKCNSGKVNHKTMLASSLLY